MTSKNASMNSIKSFLAQEALFHLSYKDGKPVKEKEPTELEELQKEFNPDKDKNPADVIKSALYADAPKAKMKMDKSINARALNQTLESYNKRRFEAKFSLQRPKMTNPPYATIKTNGWRFYWDIKAGKVSTIKKPNDGYNIDYKNSELTQFNDKNLQKIYSILEKHINLKKN